MLAGIYVEWRVGIALLCWWRLRRIEKAPCLPESGGTAFSEPTLGEATSYYKQTTLKHTNGKRKLSGKQGLKGERTLKTAVQMAIDPSLKKPTGTKLQERGRNHHEGQRPQLQGVWCPWFGSLRHPAPSPHPCRMAAGHFPLACWSEL